MRSAALILACLLAAPAWAIGDKKGRENIVGPVPVSFQILLDDSGFGPNNTTSACRHNLGQQLQQNNAVQCHIWAGCSLHISEFSYELTEATTEDCVVRLYANNVAVTSTNIATGPNSTINACDIGDDRLEADGDACMHKVSLDVEVGVFPAVGAAASGGTCDAVAGVAAIQGTLTCGW